MKKRRIKGIQMIPYGLLAGVMIEDSIEERQREVRLTEISSEGFRIRLCRRGKAEENIYPKAFKICFYQMDQAEYREIEIRHFQTEAGEQTEFYQAYDIFTVQEDYKEAFQKLCVEYSRYISLKLEEDDAHLAQEMTGYPAQEEEEHFKDETEQNKEWFQNAEIFRNLPAELAVELDHPKLYEQYLTRPIERFMKEYWQQHGIKDARILGRQPDRLYIGNQFCPHLFPKEEQFFALLEKADKERMEVTVAFSFIREDRLAQTEQLLTRLDEWCKQQETSGAEKKRLEVVVNDWGLAHLVKRTEHLIPCLGTLLNKRKKDPRMFYKMGDKTLLEQNNLNAGFYRTYLEESFGISCYEWESCGYTQEIPQKIQNHLHVPFYQTNTSSYCTLCAVLEHGERGKQRERQECPAPCLEHSFFYPKHLYMKGKYNSLFALDKHLLDEPEQLKRELGIKWNRLVVNLL